MERESLRGLWKRCITCVFVQNFGFVSQPDKWNCEDESNCNGYQYGLNCESQRYGGEETYYGAHEICDGEKYCNNNADEQDCEVTDSTEVQTCIQYKRKYEKSNDVIVPILNNTRCFMFNTTGERYPYCWDYSDQTNCFDIERVGGYCEVNGFMANISKHMVCYDVDPLTGQSIKLCDDNSQNICISPSINDCEIHKHKLCNGDADCLDNADEVNDLCEVMTEDFKCKRRFLPKKGKIELPVSWIMDGEKDCIEGEDEDSSIWKYCLEDQEFGQIKVTSKSCKDVYNCPRGEKQFVPFDQLCDGVESCGVDGAENEVCRTSREFPPIPKKVLDNNELSPCIDLNVNCSTTEFIRPQGDVFGEAKIDLLAPTSKVKCNELFGENYLYLSCMDLCVEEDVKCPLTDRKRKLDYTSCPGQYENRAVTLGNNSYLTFLDISNARHYHQNIFQCNNSRCVEYSQVCDLVDDCGDMSDEINCANHMTCKNTVNSTKHQFIALAQKCDGIYDCFDLSDECNDSCMTYILGHWAIKCFCWIMGILAFLFNLFTVVRGISSMKKCTTEGMMTSKVLMNLIGCGDFLIGVYLIILSIYDSIVYGDKYCENQAVWLTGAACLSLGVISTIGSQLSDPN